GDVRPLVTGPPRRDPLLLAGAAHAVTACRCLDAFSALARLFAARTDRRRRVTRFLERYGALVGSPLPHPGDPDRAAVLAGETAAFLERCFRELDGDPRGLQRNSAARRELRRTLVEQMYDDAAALVVGLPPPGSDRTAHLDRRLAALGAGLFVAYAHHLPDVLPETLTEPQKRALSRQAAGAFARARGAARRLLPEAEWRRLDAGAGDRGAVAVGVRFAPLYAALLRAEHQALGWIATRESPP
ncbi:MAG: hypothetical protein ACE5JG_11560, partial [Planctomycetota bacterium]